MLVQVLCPAPAMPSAATASATWANHRLDGAPGTAAMGRAEMTSHKPEVTVASRNHRQSCSHSNQVAPQPSHTLQPPEMAEWQLTALTYVISLCIIVFFISQLR